MTAEPATLMPPAFVGLLELLQAGDLDAWVPVDDYLEEHGLSRTYAARALGQLYREQDLHAEAEAVEGLIWIPPGRFVMGSPDGEEGRHKREGPQHEVTLSGYWVHRVPVTQRLWAALMGSNPSRFKEGPDAPARPVEQVSWDDCQELLTVLRKRVPAFVWDLPTEAQWENACRAGTTGARYGKLGDVAWYFGNSGGRGRNRNTHPVGRKVPNAWGLYDTLGNVWEWCRDSAPGYQCRPYTPEPRVDPVGGVDPLPRTGCSVEARGATAPGTYGRRFAAPARLASASSTSASGSLGGEPPFLQTGSFAEAPGTAAPGTYVRHSAKPTRPTAGTTPSASGSQEGEPPFACTESSAVAHGSTTTGAFGRRTASPPRLAPATATSASGSPGGDAPFADPGSFVVGPGTTPETHGPPSALPLRHPSEGSSSASGCPPVEDSGRVIRGGSWDSDARYVRAAYRYAFTPDARYDNVGFRLAGGER